MSMFDAFRKKAEEAMKDPGKRAKIEQMAKERGIDINEAKKRFLKRNGK